MLTIELPYDWAVLLLCIRRHEKIRPHSSSYMNVHSSIFCNSQKVETAYMSIKWQMDNYNVVYSYMEYYSAVMKNEVLIYIYIFQFSSVAQSCPTLCSPMNHSTPGLPVYHQLPEFTQTHVHWVMWCHLTISSSVVPFSSCPQSFPASGSFQMSQLFTSGGQILEFQLQHQSFQWTPRTNLL